METMIYRLRYVLMIAVVWLAGCAGTIQRDTAAGATKLEGATYRNVEVVLTEPARKLQAENPQFNVRELADLVRRRLDSLDLVKGDGKYRVEIVIENFRVRPVFAAVMFGIMAGTDSIDGYVRIFDSANRQVHGYKVNASYGLGGWAGGQDGMRMNWLYGKFSELAVAELAGATKVADVGKGKAATVAATSKPVSMAPSVVAASPAPLAGGYARIDDVDAIPYLSDKGRENYREWLTKPTPKAYAISTSGQWFGAWGRKPADPTHPTDPSERAMHVCQLRSKGACALYAVNGSVVWTKPAAAPAAAAEAAVVRPVNFAAATSNAPRASGTYQHSRSVPPASGYADADNSNAVPVAAEGKSRYVHYLTLPSPKAFVVYDNGGWRFWFNSRDSMTNLLDTCAREGRKCWLYAVDDQVVWRDDAQQRIGRSDQLAR